MGRVVSEGGAWAGIYRHSAFLDKIKDALDAESRLARLAVTLSCNETMESVDFAWRREGASQSVCGGLEETKLIVYNLA